MRTSSCTSADHTASARTDCAAQPACVRACEIHSAPADSPTSADVTSPPNNRPRCRRRRLPSTSTATSASMSTKRSSRENASPRKIAARRYDGAA